MERIGSLLLFAAFFYLMMRYGCGAHMVHGHHRRGHQGPESGSGRALKDPVCGMEVESGHGYAEAFAGHEYRFCSRKCLDKFDGNPQQFAHA